jgi:hypothetical protein
MNRYAILLLKHYFHGVSTSKWGVSILRNTAVKLHRSELKRVFRFFGTSKPVAKPTLNDAIQQVRKWLGAASP